MWDIVEFVVNFLYMWFDLACQGPWVRGRAGVIVTCVLWTTLPSGACEFKDGLG